MWKDDAASFAAQIVCRIRGMPLSTNKLVIPKERTTMCTIMLGPPRYKGVKIVPVRSVKNVLRSCQGVTSDY